MNDLIAQKICDRSVRFSVAYQNGLSLLRLYAGSDADQLLIDGTATKMVELHTSQAILRERLAPEVDWAVRASKLGADASLQDQVAAVHEIEALYHGEIAPLHEVRCGLHERLATQLTDPTSPHARSIIATLGAMSTRLALHKTHLLKKHRHLRAQLASQWVDAWPLAEVLPIIEEWVASDPMDGMLQNLFCRLTAIVKGTQAGAKQLTRIVQRYPSLGLYRTQGFKCLQEQARARGIPSIFLNTQFKSGSGFLLHTLCQGLNAPYTYVTTWGYGNYTLVPEWITDFGRGGVLSQDHLPADPEFLGPLLGTGIRRMLVHVRDPRQSMLSAIHYFEKNISERDPEARLMFRHAIPKIFLEMTLSERIDYYIKNRIFERNFAHDVEWVRRWLRTYHEKSLGIDILLTDFRDLAGKNRQIIEKILDFFQIQDHFNWTVVDDTIAKPTIDSNAHLHFRKGEVDEWRSVLTPPQIEQVNSIMGNDLVKYFDLSPSREAT